MEGGERWRVTTCDDGGSSQDKSSVLNQIMRRFRPIAPKPVPASSESPTGKNSLLALGGRTKRKYVRVRKKTEGNGKDSKDARDHSTGEDYNINKRVETLQLLPEGSDNDQSTDGGGSSCVFDPAVVSNNSHHRWLSLSKIGDDNYRVVDSAPDPAAAAEETESWVTVECVTGTCMMAAPPLQGLGFRIRTDEERMMCLDGDTCPGLVSDCWNRVQWLNGAFRRMVTRQEQQRFPPEISVWLAMNEDLPYTHSAFTCRVKLKYAVVGERGQKFCYSQMVPCDLWRMDGGGFAWRLDVEAALTLGR